jgi:hypothetical protein
MSEIDNYYYFSLLIGSFGKSYEKVVRCNSFRPHRSKLSVAFASQNFFPRDKGLGQVFYFLWAAFVQQSKG